MHIEAINQEFVILSQEEAVRFHRKRQRHWNILSICNHRKTAPVEFPNARKIKRLWFDDVEGDFPEDGQFAATANDIKIAIAFSQDVEHEPLLVHCYGGISRSTAIAWLIIYDKLKPRRDAVRRAFDIVRELRPIMEPNRHILRLGITVLALERARKTITRQFDLCLAELPGAGWAAAPLAGPEPG